MLTDYQGNKVTQVLYKPYGETYELSGDDIFHYKYTTQEEDNTTGLYYYSARFYDPAIGRFISPDTMIPDPTGTQDFNRYMYVKGNPIKYNDPSGHYPDYIDYYWAYYNYLATYSPQGTGTWEAYTTPSGETAYREPAAFSVFNGSSTSGSSSSTPSGGAESTTSTIPSYGSSPADYPQSKEGASTLHESATRTMTSTTYNIDIQNSTTHNNSETLFDPFIESIPSSGEILSPYGWRPNPFNRKQQEFHGGIDFKYGTGFAYSVRSGRITQSNWVKGYGFTVMIDYNNGEHGLYAHLEKQGLSLGTRVLAGDIIGIIGMTGRATGPHSHYEHFNILWKRVDPTSLFQ